MVLLEFAFARCGILPEVQHKHLVVVLGHLEVVVEVELEEVQREHLVVVLGLLEVVVEVEREETLVDIVELPNESLGVQREQVVVRILPVERVAHLHHTVDEEQSEGEGLCDLVVRVRADVKIQVLVKRVGEAVNLLATSCPSAGRPSCEAPDPA